HLGLLGRGRDPAALRRLDPGRAPAADGNADAAGGGRLHGERVAAHEAFGLRRVAPHARRRRADGEGLGLVTASPAPPGRIVLLGPQRLAPTLSVALREAGFPDDSPIALVTAGWQEREGEDGELREHLGGRGVNLELYARALRVSEAD